MNDRPNCDAVSSRGRRALLLYACMVTNGCGSGEPNAVDPMFCAELRERRNTIAELLERYTSNDWSVSTPPLELFHVAAALDSDFTIGGDEKDVTFLDWLAREGSWRRDGGKVALLEQARHGWQFRGGDTRGVTTPLEAHHGQFLFKLSEMLDATSGSPIAGPDDLRIPLPELVHALAVETHAANDTSYALPVLYRWINADEVVNRFGQPINATNLLRWHLLQEGRSVYCGGAHWLYALAFAVRGQHDRVIEPALLRDAEQRLEAAMTAALDGLCAEFRFQRTRPEYQTHEDERIAQISFQAHTLEWLLVGMDDTRFRDEPRLHAAFDWLLDRLTREWGLPDPLTRSHAIRACRMYLERLGRSGLLEACGISGVSSNACREADDQTIP